MRRLFRCQQPMRTARAALVLALFLSPLASRQVGAQGDPQPSHHHHHPLAPAAGPAEGPSATDHSAHGHAHDVGPPGRTYDLRWIDAMVQHHTGALRMSEFVFDIGVPGVGALGKEIWRDQAQIGRAHV